MKEGARNADLLEARRAMQTALLRGVFWLVTLASAVLVAREYLLGGPARAAALGVVLGATALVVFYLRPAWRRQLAIAFFAVLVALIARGALDMGGAAGPALSFAFVPGFLACLVLGPAWGWSTAGLVLGCFAWLHFTTTLPSTSARLRFGDEAAMTVFVAGLAHALVRSFKAYEAALGRRRAQLERLQTKREAMTAAIYERLDPLSSGLVHALEGSPTTTDDPGRLGRTLDELVQHLRDAKVLARREEADTDPLGDPDPVIRSSAMRVWLRLAAGLSGFFVLRNALAGVAFAPSFFTAAFCVAFDVWLSKKASKRHLELTAFAIGCAATGPMLAYLVSYGPTPDAPPLVVTPGTVVFTALLGQSLSTWAVLALNVGILGWVTLGQHPTLGQYRLLGNVALSFLVVVIALQCVLELRSRYIRALAAQGQALEDALRQQRRLAGTLFHDVSNHLQALVFHVELGEHNSDWPTARSLAERIQRLIALSKGFLLASQQTADLELRSIQLREALESLRVIFAPRLAAKQMTLIAEGDTDLSVRAQPELFIESVLGNLLSNAIKFSPPGSVIHFVATSRGPLVRAVVSDRGPGLPEEVRRRLGLDDALPSREGTAGESGHGYGLGLALEHLRRMGGRLDLDARSDGGTDATVWLPKGAS